MIDANEGAQAPDDEALFASLTSQQGEEQKLNDQPDADSGHEAPAPSLDGQAQGTQAQQGRMAPVAELVKTRNRAQAAEAERDALRNESASMKARLDAMERMLSGVIPRQQAPAAPQPVDFFDDPDAALDSRLSERIAPVSGQLKFLAGQLAVVQHGEDKVRAAQEAFDAAVERGELHNGEIERVLRAPNPYAAAVAWHQNQIILREVGTDPQAYRAKLQEEMLKDPQVLQQLLEAARAQAGQQRTAFAGAKPAAAIRLPSISQVGAAALPPTSGVASDDQLFTSITARKRG